MWRWAVWRHAVHPGFEHVRFGIIGIGVSWLLLRVIPPMLVAIEGGGGACHLRQAPGLPAIAGRGVVGAPGSSRLLPIRPAPPDVTRLPRRRSPHKQSFPGGAGRIGTRSGLDAGGRLRTMRASPSRAQPRHNHNPVSRASRPARSRSGAGASAGRMQWRRVRAVSARLEAVQKVLTDPTELPLDGLGACAHLTGPLAIQQPDIMMEVPRYEDARGDKHAMSKDGPPVPTGDLDGAAQSLS
jgi:hypothetical protein